MKPAFDSTMKIIAILTFLGETKPKILPLISPPKVNRITHYVLTREHTQAAPSLIVIIGFVFSWDIVEPFGDNRAHPT